MSPDVARAIPRLREQGILGDSAARLCLRVARGELVSVHAELRLLLYTGVALVVSGVGVLVQESLDRIGPVVVAVAIGIAAAVSLAWTARRAPPFSWGPTESTHVAFDYILLLGVLLVSADLAYVETRFTPLGANWPWHLLFVSLAMALLSVRFDSRVVFSLALSTFAAWRGVTVSVLERGFWSNFATAARLNTTFCGLLFVLLGLAMARTDRKAHFEPVATYLGFVLALVSLASGALTDDVSWSLWDFALLLVGAGLAFHSLYRRRFPLFAMGGLASYVAFSRLVVPGLESDTLVVLWFLLSAVAAILALVRVHKTVGRAS
jgi:hypothetical protein